jgi:hypothetical protein
MAAFEGWNLRGDIRAGIASLQFSTPFADVGGSREKSAMSAKYDIIGNNYAELRKPDQRIASIIESALGSAQTDFECWRRHRFLRAD